MKATVFTSAIVRHIGLVLLLSMPLLGLAQIGVGTTSPHPSAMMHITPGLGNNKGFILPSITSGSRVILDSTQNIGHGLIFFDTDLQKFYYFHQSPKQWYELDHDWVRKDVAGASPVVGTHIYSGVPGNVGIGTAAIVNPAAKLTVVGNQSIGSATWTQDSVPPANSLIVQTWVGIGTSTRVSNRELDVKGQVGVTGSVTADVFVGRGITPVGGILMWSGTINTATNFDANGTGVVGTPYEGWQLCNGYGTAPDMRGRFMVCALEDTTRGQIRQPGTGTEYNNPDYRIDELRGGEREHTLTVSEMPSHNHSGQTLPDGGHSHSYDDKYRTGNWDVLEDVASSLSEDLGSSNGDHTRTTSSVGDHDHDIPTSGADAPHENRPPYFSIYYIIRKF